MTTPRHPAHIGLTNTDLLPEEPYKRWNGTTWPVAHVRAYNRELARIRSRYNAGMNVEHLVNGLYNLAHSFDHVDKDNRP